MRLLLLLESPPLACSWLQKALNERTGSWGGSSLLPVCAVLTSSCHCLGFLLTELPVPPAGARSKMCLPISALPVGEDPLPLHPGTGNTL